MGSYGMLVKPSQGTTSNVSECIVMRPQCTGNALQVPLPKWTVNVFAIPLYALAQRPGYALGEMPGNALEKTPRNALICNFHLLLPFFIALLPLAALRCLSNAFRGIPMHF